MSCKAYSSFGCFGLMIPRLTLTQNYPKSLYFGVHSEHLNLLETIQNTNSLYTCGNIKPMLLFKRCSALISVR